MNLKRMLALLVVVLLAMTLVSCGGAAEPTVTLVPPTTTPAPSTPTPIPPTSTPVPPTPTVEAVANTVVEGVMAAIANGPDYIQADAQFENLNDGDADNDPFIISVRAPDDYAAGHIPGAVNISVKDLFNSDVISTLPTDKEIVVVCYTGQTASQATGALEATGFDVKALLFGMSSWTTDPNVFVKRFNPEVHADEYMTEAGS